MKEPLKWKVFVTRILSSIINFAVQMTLDAPLSRPELRTDPLSRCAALQLPKDSLAILPFYQSQAELDIMEQETQARLGTIQYLN